VLEIHKQKNIVAANCVKFQHMSQAKIKEIMIIVGRSKIATLLLDNPVTMP